MFILKKIYDAYRNKHTVLYNIPKKTKKNSKVFIRIKQHDNILYTIKLKPYSVKNYFSVKDFLFEKLKSNATFSQLTIEFWIRFSYQITGMLEKSED